MGDSHTNLQFHMNENYMKLQFSEKQVVYTS